MLAKQFAAANDHIKHISKQLQPTVVWQEHLRFDETRGQLTVLSADPVALGKAFEQLLGLYDFSKITDLTIAVNTSVDLQFLLMYLVAPPTNFPKSFKAGHIHIQLQTKGAVANMFSMLTATDIGKAIALPELDTFKVFGEKKISWELAGTKDEIFHDLEKSCQAALRLFPQKESREPIVTAFKDMVNYLNTHTVTYIEPGPHFNNMKMRPAVIQPEYLAKVREGDVLYAFSDESLHMFISGTTLNFVDPGNLAAPAYGRAILNKENIDTVNIILTHSHSDHLAGLLQLLRELNRSHVNYKLSIPDSLLYQFTGFVAAHREELAALNINRHIQLVKQGSNYFTGNSYMQTFTKVTRNLRHFIPNASYAFIENKHMRYFSGDISLDPAAAPKPTATEEEKRKYKRRIQYAFTTYFRNIFLNAKRQGIDSLELFTDFGHFPLQWQGYMEATFDRMIKHYGFDAKKCILYKEHLKEMTGTREAVSQHRYNPKVIVDDAKRRFTAVWQNQPFSIAQ